MAGQPPAPARAHQSVRWVKEKRNYFSNSHCSLQKGRREKKGKESSFRGLYYSLSWLRASMGCESLARLADGSTRQWQGSPSSMMPNRQEVVRARDEIFAVLFPLFFAG